MPGLRQLPILCLMGNPQLGRGVANSMARTQRQRQLVDTPISRLFAAGPPRHRRRRRQRIFDVSTLGAVPPPAAAAAAGADGPGP